MAEGIKVFANLLDVGPKALMLKLTGVHWPKDLRQEGGLGSPQVQLPGVVPQVRT